MEELIHFFTKGGVVSAVMAVVIVLLTAVIKQPIKLLHKREYCQRRLHGSYP